MRKTVLLTVLCVLLVGLGVNAAEELSNAQLKAGISATGDLQSVVVQGEKIAEHLSFIFCAPVSPDTDKAEKIFLYASNWNASADKAVFARESVGGKEIVRSMGSASKKGAFGDMDVFTFKNETVVDGPRISIKYDVEFTQTLKWDMFTFATMFDPSANEVEYEETTSDGRLLKGLFPKNFVTGEAKTVRLFLKKSDFCIQSPSQMSFAVEDTRHYGGQNVNLYMTPDWFSKGMVIEKGRKFTVKIDVLFSPKGIASGQSATVTASATTINTKDEGKAENIKKEDLSGILVSVMDSYRDTPAHANPLFLTKMPDSRWWKPEWKHRLPFIVAETISKNRVKCPVTLRQDFPSTVSANSIRIVTPWLHEIPCQAQVVDSTDNLIEITFVVDLSPDENLPLFVYYNEGDSCAPESSDSLLEIRETADSYAISSKRMLVEFYKVPRKDGALIRTMELFQTDGRNRVRNFMDSSGGFSFFDVSNKPLELGEIKLAGDGISRGISYVFNGGVIVDFMLFADSDVIYYRITGPSAEYRIRTHCLPYGDVLNDFGYYETKFGIVKIALNGLGYNRKEYDINKHLKEGWVCVADNQGESFGQFFDPLVAKATIYQAESSNDIILSVTASPTGTKGAIVLAHGDFTTVRNHYIDWKNPPSVIIGEPQQFEGKTLTVKEIGSQFANDLYYVDISKYPLTAENADSILNGIVDAAIRKEADYITIDLGPYRVKEILWPSNIFHNTPPQNSYLPRLVELAHAKGIGVGCCTPLLGIVDGKKDLFMKFRKKLPEGVTWGCVIGDRRLYVESSKEMAALGVDVLEYADEFQCNPKTPHFKKEFEKRYNMELPEKFDYKNLATPANHNQVLFSIDLINEMIKDVSTEVRKVNPKIKLEHCSSPANNLRTLAYGYHDLETQSDYDDYSSTDPYTTDMNTLSYTCKFCRGASGNSKPLHTWVGWGGYADGKIDHNFFTKQMFRQLLAGSNLFRWGGAAMSDEEQPGVAASMRCGVRLLRYTGLGDRIACARPLKFVAVLRDRNAFIDSVKKGECQGQCLLTDYDKRVEKVAVLKNIPIDIVFSKYFTLETIRQYPVLVIPSDRVLTNEHAKTIEQYVTEGASVVIQGESINNPVLAAMCGLKSSSKHSGMLKLKGIKGDLTEKSREFVDERLALTDVNSDILAVDQTAQPVIVGGSHGKGKWVYMATMNEFPFIEFVIVELARKLPIEISGKVYSNIFRSGNSLIVAVCNPSYKDKFSGEVKLNIALMEKAVALDVMNGELRTISDNVFSAEIAPEAVNFYVIDSENRLRPPVFHAEELASSFSYAARAGMAFLRLKEISEVSATTQEREPKDKNFLYVGVFKGKDGSNVFGWNGIMEGLADCAKYVKTSFIENLKSETISYYDVVIVPCLSIGTLPDGLNKDWRDSLRKYVNDGGGVLLVHNSIGPRGSIGEPVFPELAQISGNSTLKNMSVTTEHPIVSSENLTKRCGWDTMNPTLDILFNKARMKVGQMISTAYADHTELELGADGLVIVSNVDKNGEMFKPTVAAGKFGKGRVVISGILLGASLVPGTEWGSEEKVPNEGELPILLNSVFWLAGEKQ